MATASTKQSRQMPFRSGLVPFLLAIFAVGLFVSPLAAAQKKRLPNIVFIMADDLGYGELGCYGQDKIKTPNIDRLAKQGMRFTQFYAGNAVCAPSRCVLMTGKHSGHAYVRSNREVRPEGQLPILAAEVTIAEILKMAGYVTACIGKWGLGPPASSGDPIEQGFDHFFGYNCQRHAHNYYPKYLWRNNKKVWLEGNKRGLTGKQYSHDLMEKEALTFIKKNKDRPFFLYLPFTIPHVALQVPDDALKPYLGKLNDKAYKGGKGYLPHPHPHAAYAAMVSRLDRTVGRIVDLLDQLGLDENTIVFFTSDNGATHGGVGGSDSIFFHSNGPLRDFKGSLHEGGIREPMIVRWTGRIRPGSTSDFIGGFQDVMPTLCDIAGAKTPKNIDGISFLPTLLGKGKQKRHAYLYWEFHGYGGQQAVRMGDWKAIRKNLHKGKTTIYLYNLAKDIGEKNNVAAQHPQIVARMRQIMQREHVPSKQFPIKVLDNRK